MSSRPALARALTAAALALPILAASSLQAQASRLHAELDRREAGGTLDLVVAAPRVLKVLALTGLDVVIPMHSTLDEALGA